MMRNWIITALTVAFALLASPISVRAGVLTGLDVESAGNAARVTLTFRGEAPDAKSFALDGPRRLVVDLAGTENGAGRAEGAGPVSGVRSGQFTAAVTRVVLDLDAPAEIAAPSRAGNRIVFKASPVAAGDFAALVKRGSRSLRFRGEAVAAAESVRPAPKPAARRTQTAAREVPASSTRTRREPPRRTYTGLPVVVIDPGHGGRDPGSPAVTGGTEKDAVLGIARAIRDELNESGRVRAILTRDDDRYIPHRERTSIARRSGAQLFISVHADSFPKDPSVSGATIYTLSENASDAEAARLAARENRSDIIAGVDLATENDDVTSILIDLAQRETMNSSAGFAAMLQREMVGAGVPFRSHFHRFAGFLVLKAPDVPAVLLETGYMSNRDDAKYLFSKEGKQEIASGVRRAVEAHFLRKLAHR